jgi:hypothetical protein
LKLAVCQQFALTADLKPFHVAGKALMAIRPGRKERHSAILAAGPHNFIVFQVSHKIIDFGNGGKAYRAEFFKPIVYFFNFAHYSFSKNKLVM